MNAEVVQTYDPHTGSLSNQYHCSTTADVQVASERARAVFFQEWRSMPAALRSKAILSVANHIREYQQLFAEYESSDTGKSFETAMLEVEAAADLWEYAAALVRVEHTETLGTATSSGLAITLREPMGTVGLIVPWNYPLITVSERMPFALAAGCCVLLKPSELAVGSLDLLVKHIQSNHLFPENTVQVLYGVGTEVPIALCTDPCVDMIAFVGSTTTGRIIESKASACGKRVTSELGGNNHVLVFQDADLAKAADAAVISAMRNGGQACIAGTHVLVDPLVADEFIEFLSRALQHHFPLPILNENNTLQPMITIAHKERIIALAEQGLSEGCKLVVGSRMNGPHQTVGPLVFDHVSIESILRKQEIFGPVLTVCRVNENQFYPILADNKYGLAAYIWTKNMETALQMVRQLRIGRMWVNADPEKWLPELPVGGFGASGVGRETGCSALNVYSLPKSVLIC